MTLLSFLFATLALAAPQVGPVDTVKMQDGKIAQCRSARDEGTVGYRPGLAAALPEGENLRLSFSLFGVVCENNSGAIAWGVRPLNDYFFTTDANGELTTNYIVGNEAVVTGPKMNSIYGVQPLTNTAMQMVNISLVLEKILSPNELDLLAAGKLVTVQVKFYNRMNMETLFRGFRSVIGPVNGGAYSFSFEVRKNAEGKLQASPVRIR